MKKNKPYHINREKYKKCKEGDIIKKSWTSVVNMFLTNIDNRMC